MRGLTTAMLMATLMATPVLGQKITVDVKNPKHELTVVNEALERVHPDIRSFMDRTGSEIVVTDNNIRNYFPVPETSVEQIVQKSYEDVFAPTNVAATSCKSSDDCSSAITVIRSGLIAERGTRFGLTFKDGEHILFDATDAILHDYGHALDISARRFASEDRLPKFSYECPFTEVPTTCYREPSIYFSGDNRDFGRVMVKMMDAGRNLSFNGYGYSNHEAFAYGFHMYYKSPETRKDLAKTHPELYVFMLRFEKEFEKSGYAMLDLREVSIEATGP